MPRIGEIVQKLEGFQYATVLNLNMVYYTIEILTESCKLTNTITEFGKFRYNISPVGLCTSGDTFQAKVYDLLGDI